MPGVDIKVSPDIIQPIIQAQITAQIAAVLGQHDQRIIEEIVRGVLTLPVGSDGKHSEYSYQNKQTFIEWIVQDAIRRAAEQAVKGFVTANGDKLRIEVEKQFKASTKQLAKIFVSGLVDAVSTQWRFNVNVSLDTPKDN